VVVVAVVVAVVARGAEDTAGVGGTKTVGTGGLGVSCVTGIELLSTFEVAAVERGDFETDVVLERCDGVGKGRDGVGGLTCCPEFEVGAL
jgi:hypothetical protein